MKTSRRRSFIYIAVLFLGSSLSQEPPKYRPSAFVVAKSKTKSRDYHAPFAFLHPPVAPFLAPNVLLFRIPRSSLDRRFSHSTQARRFYLRHRNSSFLHIYYPSRLGAGFCAYCVVDPILSFAGQYLSSGRKRRYRERREQAFLARGPVRARDSSSGRFFSADIHI